MVAQNVPERSAIASAAALRRHALTDPVENTKPARRAFRLRFEREVADAARTRGEELTPAELRVRTDRLVRAHMIELNRRRWREARRAAGSAS